MAEDKSCDPRGTAHNKSKKKRKRRKNTESTPAHTQAENPRKASLPLETSSVPPQGRDQQRAKARTPAGRKRGQSRGDNGGDDETSKFSPQPAAPAEDKEGQGCEAEKKALGKESLRWEGALEDPQAEERRLEAYRANRRERYLAHREALLQEMQGALRKNVS